MAKSSKPPVVFAGERYGRLVVLAEDGRDNHGKRTYRCICDCGATVTAIHSWNLRSGNTKSCGCHRIAVIVAQGHANRRHGHSRSGVDGDCTRTFRSWAAMQSRCRNPNDGSYAHYGGRGISIADRWLGTDGFANFLADLGDRPTGRSLDRINVDGNYEPGNCRWATASEQSRNRRPYRGRTERYRRALEAIVKQGDGIAKDLAKRALEAE